MRCQQNYYLRCFLVLDKDCICFLLSMPFLLLRLKLQSSFLSFFMRFEASSPDPPSSPDAGDEDLDMTETDENGTNKGNIC